MNVRNIVGHAWFAVACVVALCLSWNSDAHAADPIQVEGQVVDANGEPLPGVTIMRWGRGNLLPPDKPGPGDAAPRLDPDGKNYLSGEDGKFVLPPSSTVDAVLFFRKDHHIKVKAVPKGKAAGRLAWRVEMQPMEFESYDYASAVLTFSQIANEYERLALLVLPTDQLTRRFIMFEFEKMEVVPRLESLRPPPDKEAGSYLNETKHRIETLFRSLQAGERRKRF